MSAPIIRYLATVGAGELVVAGDDVVERSNLQRQVVYCDDDMGALKVGNTAASVYGLNPDVSVEPIEARVDRSNACEVVVGSDMVVDASDNFPTRYLLNDAYRFEGIPLAHGATYKFEEQTTTLVPDKPCCRCLFPGALESGMTPDCATTNVLDVLPGTVGCVQVMEMMKLLLDENEVLDRRLLFYGTMNTTFKTVPYRMNPDCPVCGEGGIDPIGGIDYVENCAISLD